MKRLTIIILVVFLSIFASFGTINAKSGCCSWHGGVSHCDTSVGRQVCNDGTYSPSCTCAKVSIPRIYCGDSSCNGTEKCSTCSIDCGACPIPMVSPQINTTNNLPNQNSGVVAGASTEKSSSSWIWWILGMIGVGVVGYKIGKNKRD
jgi:hypothetical protein